MPEPLPESIGRFRVLEELGHGTMGVVYKAHDPLMDRIVALKLIRLAFVTSEAQRDTFEQRFLTEARAVARLQHPNIVVAHDVGRDDRSGHPYIALEYLVGRTLAQVAAEGRRQDWREVLRLCARVAEALHYAHQQGVVHRDVKPANVMVLESGEPKLMDFGLAKLQAGLELITSGQSIGTPLYMSPEQALGSEVDGRSDLFSLGAVAYTLLTGRRAFEAESVPRILNRVVHDEPARASRVNRTLPLVVDYLLARALAKRPEDRYPDGRTLAQDIEDVLNGRSPRHRSAWALPPGAEQTQPTRSRETAAGAQAVGGLSGATRDDGHASGDSAGAAPAAGLRPSLGSRLPIALLALSMLTLGSTLFFSPFWRQRLAGTLGVVPEAAPASPAPSVAPSIAAPAPSELGSPEGEPSPSPPPSDMAQPASESSADPAEIVTTVPAAEETPPPSSSPTPSSEAASPDAAALASPSASVEVAPEPAPAASPSPRSPANGSARPKKPAPRPARLRISVTHDLPSGRLKVLVDGRVVVEEPLKSRRKRYLLFFTRREGKAEASLPLPPGRRRITVQVRSGSRLHQEDVSAAFESGVARQLDVHVSGADGGLAFDWE